MNFTNKFLQSDFYKNAPTPTISAGLSKTYTYMLKYPRIMVNVSGGADSDCMIDIVEHIRKLMPDYWYEDCFINYVWFDTGLEMEATKRHLTYLENKYDIKIHRVKSQKQVAQAVKEHGYPFLTKQQSEYIDRLQKHNFQWEDDTYENLVKKYPNCQSALRWWCNNWREEPHRPLQTEIASKSYLKEFIIANPPSFKISIKCCDYAKKHIGDKYRKQIDAQIQFIGIRKAEGGTRSTTYNNCFIDGKHGIQHFPLFWWTNEDKEEYEKYQKIKHSDAYTIYGCTRTGCAGCPFSANCFNEIEMLKTFEPNLAKAVSAIFKPALEYRKYYIEFRDEMKKKNKK